MAVVCVENSWKKPDMTQERELGKSHIRQGFIENLNDNELYLVIDCIVLGIPFRIRKLYTYTVLILISLFHLFPQYASEFKKSFDREKFNNQKFYFLKFFSFFNF